jgi:hypothetical protein
MRVDGHVRGYISGMVDAQFSGTLYGTINAAVEAGAIRRQEPPQLPESSEGKEADTHEENA